MFDEYCYVTGELSQHLLVPGYTDPPNTMWTD